MTMARARTRGDKGGKEENSLLLAAVGLAPTAVMDAAAWAMGTTTSMLTSSEMKVHQIAPRVWSWSFIPQGAAQAEDMGSIPSGLLTEKNKCVRCV
ncbi:hypothetical protein PIB30_041138 [Stylosanthes scabra]|uniref:Uncharacterized protein n=1 Tax=Stylosanthes scabra TaxID=79078 RepID=A0ABU6SFM9_9FABA|nr:hypothetical protein [Stylosanthes scabra]